MNKQTESKKNTKINVIYLKTFKRNNILIYLMAQICTPLFRIAKLLQKLVAMQLTFRVECCQEICIIRIPELWMCILHMLTACLVLKEIFGEPTFFHDIYRKVRCTKDEMVCCP